MAKPITIKITGDASGLKKALDGASSMVGAFGSAVTTAVKSGALAGAGAAAAGIAAFTQFDTQLREVLTLLPGAGEDTFNELGDKVKEFSTEFGKLPSEVIPSLYSALSAGVPEDNVFEFLEVAQMAAKGGVTELETAVDGISSVVNAYGSEVIGATEASDLMFTAVRLGKTTFDEMSSSLFQVAPIASSLGVNFDSVTASIANLTATGTPTAVAATQMKAALSELGKEGSKADQAFRELTGMGFTSFLETEGNMASAFMLLAEGAQDSGKSVLDMFGSIEAGQAVLSLTADGGDKLLETLGEMSNSAGATEAAFETMDGSLGSSFDRIKANLAVAAVDLGQKLAPVVQKVTDFIVDHLDDFYAFADRAKEALTPFFERVVEAGQKVVGWVTDHWPQISATISKVTDVIVEGIQSWIEWMQEYLPPVIEAVVEVFEEVVAWISDNWPTISQIITTVISTVQTVLGSIIDWVRQNWPTFQTIIKTVIDAVTAVLSAVVDWVRQNWGSISETFMKVKDAVVNAVTLIIDIVTRIIDAFRGASDGAEGEGNRLVGIVTTILDVFKTAFEMIAEVVTRVVEIVQFIWRNFGDEIMAVIEGAIKFIINTIEAFLQIIKGIFQTIKAIVTGDWSGLFEGLKNILGGWWDWMTGVFGLIKDTIVGVFGGLAGTVKDKLVEMVDGAIDFLGSVPGRFLDAASALGSAILDGISAGLKGAVSLVGDIVTAIKNALIDSLNWIIDKMNDGIPDKLGWDPLAIDLPDNPIPHISKAMGGPASGLVTVGERGPEMVALPRGSRVIPNHSLAASSGGVTVNVSTNADPHQIGREVAWVLKTAGV